MTVAVFPRGRFSVVTGIPPFFVPPTWNGMARELTSKNAGTASREPTTAKARGRSEDVSTRNDDDETRARDDSADEEVP